MNQKDYKEIAGIINDVLPNDTYWKPKLCNKLADYFEREADTENKPNVIFNQQQFLKDCGVK